MSASRASSVIAATLPRTGGGARLSRPLHTHRVAIANSRLITLTDKGVTFKWKDYRAKGRQRLKVTMLATSSQPRSRPPARQTAMERL